jgi:hypothetical protein
MHTLTAVVLCGTLACLAGCVLDASEALETNSNPAALSPQPAAGHELFRMFSDEKAGAIASELPEQF